MVPTAAPEMTREVWEDSNHPHNEENGDTHEHMVQAVAKILCTTIIKAVDEALHKSLHSIQKSMETQAQHITETESCISLIEDVLVDFQSHSTTTEATIKSLLEKIDDLENRSRQNKLRIIGIPESYNATGILCICSKGIPEVLGLHNNMHVERAHCLGPFHQERKSP